MKKLIIILLSITTMAGCCSITSCQSYKSSNGYRTAKSYPKHPTMQKEGIRAHYRANYHQ